jgi:hypothetical protein
MSMEQDHIEIGNEARTLWVLGKDGHTMTCVISGQPGHEELQVLFDRDVYLSEAHTVHEGAIARADALHRGFEGHGWTTVPPTLPRQGHS